MRPRPETTEVTQFASKAINLLNFDSEDKTLYIKPLMIENVVDTHKLDSENKTLYIKPLTKGYGYISVTGR